jgi:integrase
MPRDPRQDEAQPAHETWVRQVEGGLASDDFVDNREARRTTLGEALERYRDEVAGTKKGERQICNRITLWLRDPLAQRFLATIRSVGIATWRTARVAEGEAPTTIKNALQIISQTYKLAASEWGMEGLKNPVQGVRLPAARAGRDRRLDAGEEQRLLEVCGCPYTYAAIIVAIETAMRQGEMLALRWDAVKGQDGAAEGREERQGLICPAEHEGVGCYREAPSLP